MSWLYTLLTAAVATVAAASTVYLLILLVAAVVARRDRGMGAGAARATRGSERPAFRVAVLVPAHNEELVLASTLESLKAQTYPAALLEIVVVADNCTDRTADIARSRGARVLERCDQTQRGKGYALDWAFSLLLSEPGPADGFVIVDADTWVAPDFLDVMVEHLILQVDVAGRCALQGRYGVLNVGEGWRADLMAAALDLFNHVRPLGADRLGLSVGLRGNGMGFTRAVLERVPWQGRSITEDIDYGLDLLGNHGIRVRYVPDARVLAQMPTTAAQAASQRERWERGRYRLLRDRSWPLLWRGVARRDWRLCDAAIGLMVPPLAELGGLTMLLGGLVAVGDVLGILPGPPVWYGAFLLLLTALLAYVAGGLWVAEAPRGVYGALLRAPWYALWKLGLYGVRLLRRPAGRGPQTEWVRTDRAAMAMTPGNE